MLSARWGLDQPKGVNLYVKPPSEADGDYRHLTPAPAPSGALYVPAELYYTVVRTYVPSAYNQYVLLEIGAILAVNQRTKPLKDRIHALIRRVMRGRRREGQLGSQRGGVV